MRDAIDFSKVERITPREDSWNKVCKKLDNQFRLISALPLVASLILMGSALIFVFFGNTTEMPINSVTDQELVSWYGNLGEGETDEFETLDQATTISYLIKE